MAQRSELKSSMSKAKSTMSRKPTASQATKKVERVANLDLAIFRFAVNPETLPHNTRLGEVAQPKDKEALDQTCASMNASAFNTIVQPVVTQQSEGVQDDEEKKDEDKHLMGPFVKIVQEKMFNDMMNERAASRQWRAIECIQACVKAKVGLGKHIPINFTM